MSLTVTIIAKLSGVDSRTAQRACDTAAAFDARPRRSRPKISPMARAPAATRSRRSQSSGPRFFGVGFSESRRSRCSLLCRVCSMASRFGSHLKVWFLLVPVLAIAVMPAIPERMLFEVPEAETASLVVVGRARSGLTKPCARANEIIPPCVCRQWPAASNT